MQRRTFLAAGAAITAAGCAGVRNDTRIAKADVDEVLAVERAFAQTMAQRDFAGFARFIDDEAEFLNGGKPLHGKPAILEFWKKQYEAPEAPFSWAPDQVEVLDSGTLALSTGLVRDPSGKPVARFNSIWRLEAPGQWRVVFDKGSPLPPAPPAQ